MEDVVLTKQSAIKAIGSYVAGFVLSVALTIEAYLVVVNHAATGPLLISFLLTLAFAQLVVQLVFFLHVGQEEKSQWNLVFLISTVGIIFTVVVGSIWIMYHLNYRMMPQYNQQIMKEENIYK